MCIDCGGPEQSCVMCVGLGNHLSQPGSSSYGPANVSHFSGEVLLHCY